jgi:signal transduction histidine kinase
VGGKIFYETHFQPLLRMQGFVREVAFDLKRHNGERLPVLVNATQRELPDIGAITRITIFDATDRRRYERELLLARTRAEEAVRARNEVITTLSHDVRAPLSAIVTALALLEKTSPSAQQQRYIRVLRSSTDQALALVNDLLDLSRLESGKSPLRERRFSVHDLVHTATAGARAAAVGKTELAIRERVDPAVPEWLIGDGPKIAQVIANLMMNAVKFTDRGFVDLIVSLGEATEDQARLEVTVSDTGMGIPADRLPHIFDEFAQASDHIAEQYGGSGLGLAICRRLLRLYGSDLHVTSTVGQGTSFAFQLTLTRA